MKNNGFKVDFGGVFKSSSDERKITLQQNEKYDRSE